MLVAGETSRTFRGLSRMKTTIFRSSWLVILIAGALVAPACFQPNALIRRALMS